MKHLILGTGFVAARLVLVAAVAGGWQVATVAAGSGPARLALAPVDQPGQYFDLTLAPGQNRSLKVEIANLGGKEVQARTYAADVYSIVNGGFGANLFGDPTSGPTRWLDYADRELTLKPGANVVVVLQVDVPGTTLPGQYISSLVAESAQPTQGGGGVEINQVNRIAIAVAIDVPGPRHPAFEIAGVSHKIAAGVSFVDVGVANHGNVHLKPAGEFVLRDAARTEIARADVTMDSVYAGTNTQLEVPLAAALRPGDYCAEVHLTDPTTKVSASIVCEPFAVVAPPVPDRNGRGSSGGIPVFQPVIDAAAESPILVWAAVTLFLLLLFVVLLLVIRRRRRRRPSESPGAGLSSPD